jgi:hypothetical protein
MLAHTLEPIHVMHHYAGVPSRIDRLPIVEKHLVV